MQWTLGLILLVIFFSRLPFLGAGYGVNVDAWRVARAARVYAETGQYEVSRFPGYPLQEITCSWLWKYGPVGLNLLSVLMALVVCIMVWKIARLLKLANPFFLVSGLAFTPIFYVSSVTSKDYIWGLAFVWLAMFTAISNRAFLSGVLLGLAVGCRHTSGAMLLPFALILIGANSGARRWQSVVILTLTTVLTAVICFFPVWQRYEWDFLTYYENVARPDILTIVKRATFEVWGMLGMLGIVIVLGTWVWKFRNSQGAINLPLANRFVMPALGLVVVIYGLAYWRYPYEAAYLLPLVPTTLLLLNWVVAGRSFRLCCVLLISASFVEIDSRGLQPGAILLDHSKRVIAQRDITRFVQFTERNLLGENLVIVGGWEPVISVISPPNTVHNHYIYLANADEVQEAINRGWGIAYAGATIREFNYRIKGCDLAQFGAIDLRELAHRKN